MEYLRKVLFEYMMGRETKVCLYFLQNCMFENDYVVSSSHHTLEQSKLLVLVVLLVLVLLLVLLKGWYMIIPTLIDCKNINTDGLYMTFLTGS